MTHGSFVRAWRLAVVALAAASLAACGINSVPTKQETAKARWADVQAAFQERANLVPNLAAVVKGAAEQEKEILTNVINARARATSVQVSADELDDPAKVKQFQQAQDQFGQSLGRLLVSVERYPDLKSIPGYTKLQDQIEGQENRIRITIKDYNEAVRDYNTEVRVFPTMIGAMVRGAKPMTPYSAVTPGAEVAPSLEGKL
ncbi:LemA family protein [Novosphingobium aquimarinum]|uniref:LemA family protein n=1 Tax=Novosphingobium aquimarinum TaxID=2682494 RepID=UPI0012EB075E|nr:LemA family protein [Novosphingobium aquimarinum]